VKKSPETALGKDFWLYQTGQTISTIGDACGNIALAWWILDATHAPEMISTVLAPAMVVQMILTPTLGPLGDRLSRKRLILVSDVVRGVAMAVIAWLAARNTFSPPGIIAIYAVFATGSALFNSNNMSIVPQIVSPDALQGAVRTSQSLQAIGRVVGGAVAAVLVSWIGVASAFMFDAASFAVAALATAAMSRPVPAAIVVNESDQVGRRGPAKSAANSLSSFITQLTDGFRVVGRVPVLFWLCIAIAIVNLMLSPMQVLLPTYAKVSRGMPAWFLGGLESSLGLGIIAGAIGIAAVEKIPHLVSSVVLGLMLIGGSMTFLPHVPGIVAPMIAMFLLGVGAAWTNIPIGTRVSIAVPDRFRSRLNSIIAFIFDACAPIGVTAGGVLIGAFGVTRTMTGAGIAVLLILPALYRIPGFVDFFRRAPEDLTDYFLKAYPRAFEPSRPATQK
jgi:DHA3 family macrolide efflux protein-like MFS transporter